MNPHDIVEALALTQPWCSYYSDARQEILAVCPLCKVAYGEKEDAEGDLDNLYDIISEPEAHLRGCPYRQAVEYMEALESKGRDFAKWAREYHAKGER